LNLIDSLRQIPIPGKKTPARSVRSARFGISLLPAMLGLVLLASAISTPVRTLASAAVELPNQSDRVDAGRLMGAANSPYGQYSQPVPVRSIPLGAEMSDGFSGNPSVAALGHRSPLLATLEAEPTFTVGQNPTDGATGLIMAVTRVFDPFTGDVPVELESFGARLTYPNASANPAFPAGTRCVNILNLRNPNFPLDNGGSIDNSLGIATFNRSNSAGVTPPVNLGHALTRLTGSTNQECPVNFELTSLSEVDGNQIAAPAGLTQVLRRGDARADGFVDVADALFVAQQRMGLRNACNTQVSTTCLHSINSASVRHDGAFDQVTIADARFIAENLVGLRDGSYNLGPPKVDIALIPAQSRVRVGAQFNTNVEVYSGSAHRVDAAQVYLDFNPSRLRVVALTGGTTLPDQFQSTFDNTLGRIAYAAGRGIGPSNGSVATPFTLVTVHFQAAAPSGEAGTDIVFSPPAPPRQTKSIFGAGHENTGQLFRSNIIVTPGEGTIILLNDSFDRPNSQMVGSGWVELESSGATVSIAGNKLFFDDTSDVPHRPLVRRSFTPVDSGILQWDFDFDWTRTSGDSNHELWMQLGDSTLMVNSPSGSTQFNGVGVNLRWGGFGDADQNLVARQDATMGGPTPLTIISGPTHVSVTADLATRTYSVTIDGVVVGSRLNFDNLGTVSKLDTVRFLTNNLNESNFSGRTFDNVIISAE